MRWLPLVLLASCGLLPPKGQVVLYLDTDAVLPGDPKLPMLFDRVRVDVYKPGEQTACPSCTHVFGVDTSTVNGKHASVGIAVDPSVPGYRARVRLYRSNATHQGEPNIDSSIDVTASLPVAPLEGIVECNVMLHTDDVAKPVGSLDAPVPVASGPVTQGHAGTWPGAQRTSSCGDLADEEVCIPGGAFFMGNPLAIEGNGESSGADIQRLVVLSPFVMDAHEVTVKAFRPKSTATNVEPWSGYSDGKVYEDWCTFSTRYPDLPVNCVTPEGARAFCKSRGGDLPSEAQYEYVASGLQGSLYVWGSDDPTCEEAVYGLGGYGVRSDYASNCSVEPKVHLPLPPVRDRTDRDQLVLPTGTVVDLAGNLSEWTSDEWDPQDGPCWGTGIFTDPVCQNGSKILTARGGSFLDVGTNLRAALRNKVENQPRLVSVQIGFRCVRPVQ